MMKSLMFHMMLMWPLLINSLMIILFIYPTKKNKFHPLSLMIILITLTMLITNKMNFSYYSWMPYILFLAMIGGLMVIFMYIVSLVNNKYFFINFKNIIINIFKILSLLSIFLFIYMNLPNNFYINFNIQDTWKINKIMYMYDQLNINILYNEINYKSSLFIMSYIYFTMICIMNICYKLKAPLRQLMY